MEDCNDSFDGMKRNKLTNCYTMEINLAAERLGLIRFFIGTFLTTHLHGSQW